MEYLKEREKGWLDEHSDLALVIFKELFRELYQAPDFDTDQALLGQWIEQAKASPVSVFHDIKFTRTFRHLNLF